MNIRVFADMQAFHPSGCHACKLAGLHASQSACRQTGKTVSHPDGHPA
jgi:hypothetical protein